MRKYTTTMTGDLERNESGECYLVSDVDVRIAELERDLTLANDAAAKGDLARQTAAGMEMTITELQQALRQIYTGAAEESDGLSYEEIAEIANKALSL